MARITEWADLTMPWVREVPVDRSADVDEAPSDVDAKSSFLKIGGY